MIEFTNMSDVELLMARIFFYGIIISAFVFAYLNREDGSLVFKWFLGLMLSISGALVLFLILVIGYSIS